MPRCPRSMPPARLILALALGCCFLTSMPAEAITNCHDYTYFRMTGVNDRMKSVNELRDDLGRLGYDDVFTVDTKDDADDPRTMDRLRPRDVIVIGDAHSGYVSDYGRIDHFIRRENEEGPWPPLGLPDPSTDKRGGFFRGDTLAQMYGRFFTKEFYVAGVYRKKAPTDASEDDWAKAEAAARAIIEEGKKLRADAEAAARDVEAQRAVVQREAAGAVNTARSLLPALHSTQALRDLVHRLELAAVEVHDRVAEFDEVVTALTAVMEEATAAADKVEELAGQAAGGQSADEVDRLRASAAGHLLHAVESYNHGHGQFVDLWATTREFADLRAAFDVADRGGALLQGLDTILRSLDAVHAAVAAAGVSRARAERLIQQLEPLPRRVKEALAKFPADDRAQGLIADATGLSAPLGVPAEVSTPDVSEATRFFDDAGKALDSFRVEDAEAVGRANLVWAELESRSALADFKLTMAWLELQRGRAALAGFPSGPSSQVGPNPPSQPPPPTTGVIVPDVVGMIPADALSTLHAAGLVVAYDRSRAQPPTMEMQYTCERQDPPAGARAAEGEVVRVSLYSRFGVGEDDLETVPDVLGQDLDNACAIVRGHELDPVLEPIRFVNTFALGVASQDPEGGGRVRRGSIVILRYYVDAAGASLSDPPDPADPPGPGDRPDAAPPPYPANPPAPSDWRWEGTWQGTMECTASENSSTSVGESGPLTSVFTRRPDGTLWLEADTGSGQATPVQVVEHGGGAVSYRHEQGGQSLSAAYSRMTADTIVGTVEMQSTARDADHPAARLKFAFTLTRTK